MRQDEYARCDALTLADLVRRGEVSPLELAHAAAAAIDRIDPQLNAVVERYDDRIEGLRVSDLGSGPFHGVPFLVKDVGAVFAGRRVEWGSRLAEGYTPKRDTFLGELFRTSGLNALGRTNVPEFGIASTTENALHGNTSTPWRLGYSAGGSSGGAAAAVAAGIVPIAHGSDIGGSLRIPASHCGCIGLKPSRGRVSYGPDVGEGGFGMAQNFVQTRSVRDSAAMLDCLGVPQRGDPFVVARPDSFLTSLKAEPDALRIAFSAAPLGPAPVHPRVAEIVARVARQLEALGHTVQEDAPTYSYVETLPHFTSVWFFGYFRFLEGIARETGRTIGPETLEPCTLEIYRASKAMDPNAFLEAVDHYNEVRRRFGRFYERYDVWLTPACAQPPEPMGRYHQGLEGLSAQEYIELTERPVQYCMPHNVTGCPAISLPLGWTDDELPIGVQLAAPHAEEARLLRLAHQLEQAMPWRKRLPPIHTART
jgi:amidase